jgi:hypothetical protein
MAEVPHFATRTQAMDYLGEALPRATSENPKYTTKADGTVSRWLTEGLDFTAGPDGGVAVRMRERFSQEKDGRTTEGRHEASFALAEVTVAPFTQPADVTPEGAAAIGVLFTCARSGCVAALWGAAASQADKADLYVQNEATRDKIVAAFRRLQSP